jgi:hypothetical protein
MEPQGASRGSQREDLGLKHGDAGS